MLRVAAAALTLAAPGVALAQTATPAKPSVPGYLCTFAGKCDGAEAPVETRDAPNTKGFRLARPTAARSEPAAPAASSRRSRVNAVAGGSRTQRQRYDSYGTATPRAVTGAAAGAATVPGGRQRADLMIGFELNSDRLSAVGRDSARVFAQSLLTPELGDKRFLIEGHTDSSGGAAVNRSLSARRAQSVADFLVAQGVQPGRLQVRGYGSSVPLPGNRASNPANRRVEAELLR